MKKLFYSAAIALASLSIIGCEKPKTDISGEWSLTTINGVKVNEADSVYLGFNTKEKRLYGMTGCNRVMGDIILDEGNKLSFDKLGSTRMACHNDSIERIVLVALPEVSSFSVKDNKANPKDDVITFYAKDKKEIMTLKRK